MQVTQQNEFVTHAIIAPSQAIAVTMDDSPEFYHILSSTLYSDQMLAMIRETMCNAWDAHIEAGCTDKPIVVMTANNYLIIRDYGTGIPHAMVGPIYGKYGGSTKKNTKGVTGGFGLGCKSPWAYKDHFEMTDWCEGTMTIYNCSKSNAEVNGKPSILPVVSVPTTETGLQVKVQIKEGDIQRIRLLVARIANNGDMKVLLDDSELKTLPFSKAKENFLITKETLTENKQEKVLIRYGNVIYPIGLQPEFKEEFNKVTTILSEIPTNDRYNYGQEVWKIVFQAQPDTISVTPSRETLSMQGHTISTIKTLMSDFIKNHKIELTKHYAELMKQRVDNIYLVGTPGDLLDKTPRPIKTNGFHDVKAPSIILDFKDFATFSYYHRYPAVYGFREKDVRYRVQSLAQAGFIDRGLAKSFTRAMDKKKGNYSYQARWFQRRIIWPLFRDISEEPMLSIEKLWLYGSDHQSFEQKKGNNRYLDRNDINRVFTPSKNFVVQNHLSYMPFLKKVVTLAYSRPSVGLRAQHFPIVKNWLGDIEDSLVYIVARHPDKVAAAKAFFERKGYTIIDLTVAQPWEEKAIVEPQVTFTPKPKKIGISRLDNILDPNGYVSTNLAKSSDAVLIQKPEFIIVFAKKNDGISLEQISSESTQTIVELWGDKGGIVVNVNQEAKYVLEGAKPMYQYITEKLLVEFTTNPRIIESLPFDYSAWKEQDSYMWNSLRGFLRAVYSDKDLRDYFGLVWTLTPQDEKLLKLWKNMNSSLYGNGTSGYLEPLRKHMKTIKLNPAIEALGKQIASSKYLKIMDDDAVEDKMTDIRTDPKKKSLIRDFLLEMIEG